MIFEVGDLDGMVSVSDIVPKLHGNIHFIFFDRKLRGKEQVLTGIMKHVFEAVGLRRINGVIPADRVTGMSMLRRIGFTREGKMRFAHLMNGKYIDQYIYGILREEVL